MQTTGLNIEWLILVLTFIALVVIYYYFRRYKKPEMEQNSYLAALEYLVDGDHKRAVQKFKEAARENTDDIHAYLRLGDLLREKGMVSTALKIHKDLTLRSGQDSETQQKVKRSLLLDYEASGDLDQAARLSREILEEENSYRKEITSKLLSILEKKELWEEAYDASKKYIKPLTKPYQKRMALYLVFIGKRLMQEGQGKEARIKFKEALKDNAECSAAYYFLGLSYYQEDRLEDAIREWQKLASKIPSKAHVVFDGLERAWFDLGRYTEAENVYQDFLTRHPDNIHAAFALVEIYNKKGDYDRAFDILDRIESIEAGNSKLAAYRIQTNFNKGQYKTAASHAISYFETRNFYTSKNYVCQECQFISEEPLWKCPQCKSIDTFNI